MFATVRDTAFFGVSTVVVGAAYVAATQYALGDSMPWPIMLRESWLLTIGFAGGHWVRGRA